MVVVLPPSEYQGEPNTAVGGRVVLRRKFALERAQGKSSKGKRKGKEKSKTTANEKCEVHLLGGQGMQEMLFIEAWGLAAEAFLALAADQRLVQIQNPKVVSVRPTYSTSKLHYYLKIEGPVGVATLVQELASEGVWATIPMHHPFVDVAAMRKVTDTLNCCVLAKVTYQPGAQVRQTEYGESVVCNAILRLKGTTIRTSFWRQAAEKIGSYAIGSCIALYQVTVKKISGQEWELRANQSTQIVECPADLLHVLETSTDLSKDADDSLTLAHEVDYDSVAAKPSTVASLASLLMPGKMRELKGVYELHSSNVLGLSAVLSDGSYCMRCCRKCKKQIEGGSFNCSNPDHSAEEVVNRWIAKVVLSDQTGTTGAIVYHDALVATNVFPSASVAGDALTDVQTVAMQRKMRNVPWSARLIYKSNDIKQQNSLEVKRLLPTFTAESVLVSCLAPPLPEVDDMGPTCPFATCAEVRYDKDLGATFVKDKEITAVRLLIRVLQEEENEDIYD